MRKSDLITNISDKTGIPKVDVLVTIETMIKEVKESLASGENIYIRGFGSFITKKRAAKIGRNIKKISNSLFTEKDREQGYTENNCGQRCIAFLCVWYSTNDKIALSI